MIAPTTTRPKSTALVRVAGLLFVLAGLGTFALVQVVQLSAASGLVPAVALGILIPIALAVAFFLMFLWLPRTRLNVLFLVLAIGSLLTFLANRLTEPFPFALGAVLAVVAVIAAVSVVLRWELPRVTGILFLVGVLAREVSGFVLQLLGSSFNQMVFLVPIWVSAAGLALSGLALLLWPRNRADAKPA
jgi:hypothetical protein